MHNINNVYEQRIKTRFPKLTSHHTYHCPKCGVTMRFNPHSSDKRYMICGCCENVIIFNREIQENIHL